MATFSRDVENKIKNNPTFHSQSNTFTPIKFTLIQFISLESAVSNEETTVILQRLEYENDY